MTRRCFDREKDLAVLVGVHYNKEERRYYIVEDALFSHRHDNPRFSCVRPYKTGIWYAPCDYARMESAVNNAQLYVSLHFAYKFVGFVPDYLLSWYDGSLADMGKPFVIGHRRYKGEDYALRAGKGVLSPHSAPETEVTCLTPEKAFGYKDTLMLTTDGHLDQLYRHDVPTWIRNDLLPHMEFVRQTGCFYAWDGGNKRWRNT